ncbi:hypothetical protein A0O28_0112310 [Trichoderma guizhouense]|uniref:Uncharacterized protein n=1 Tax=Trichoderma guizhouense TaxID=1491466 RepID=A0A1T3C4Z3_9HYPO|nr:hypothetical protein A0O28_0112310 [Trichoderma guizhouense]
MALKPEDAQLVYLLLGVLEFFSSDLPVSKQAAESEAKARWPRATDSREEIERIRNFFDDFCVEIGLIELGLKSYYATNPSGTSVELSSTAERMLEFLESLLKTDLAPSADLSADLQKKSSERFYKIKRLRQLVVSANRLGRTFADIDGLYCGGSVQFSIEQRDAKRSLEVLQRCRSVICDSFQGTNKSIKSNEKDRSADHTGSGSYERFWERETQIRFIELKTYSRLVSRSSAQVSVEIHPPQAMICVCQEPNSSSTNTLAFRRPCSEGKVHWLLYDISLSEQTPKSVKFSAPAVLPVFDTISQIIEMEENIWSYTTLDSLSFKSGSDQFTLAKRPSRKVESYVSLRSLLEDQKLSSRERILLAAPLAEFILQSGNFWLESRRLRFIDCFFLPIVGSEESHTEVDISRPFFAISPTESSAYLDDNGWKDFFHTHPFILDLGVLLLELEYNVVIDTMSSGGRSGNIYDDYATAWEMIESPVFKRKVAKSHQSAIAACLRCDFLPVDTHPYDEEFGYLVHDYILQPLKLQEYLDIIEKPIEELGESDSETAPTEERIFGQEVAPRGREPQNRWRQLGAVLNERLQVLDEPDDEVRNTSASYANDWMKRLGVYHDQIMDSLVDTIEASEADGLPEEERIKRTKVAVIDTGICWNNPFINGARHRIKETRNWIPDNSGLVDSFDVEDKVGHGTQTTELLLAVAPGVEVCIARVSEDGLLDNENYIAEAITWAVRDCQADIVSMSFGLEDRSDVVLDAILTAYKEKKILLAAASNGGGNDGIAFPANQREVICVFATDGKGNPSPFNPTFTPEMDDGSYFSTLGEAVEVHQLPELGRAACAKIRKSGTSFATPIAAGIVANLLDYAKAKKNIGEENLRRLHSFSGMISVLKLLAPKKRGGHNYICPWMLWEDKSAKTRERYADIIRSKILIQLNS